MSNKKQQNLLYKMAEPKTLLKGLSQKNFSSRIDFRGRSQPLPRARLLFEQEKSKSEIWEKRSACLVDED